MQPGYNLAVAGDINFQPGAVSDKAEPLTLPHIVPFFNPANDAPGDETGDLNKDDITGIGRLKFETFPFVMF